MDFDSKKCEHQGRTKVRLFRGDQEERVLQRTTQSSDGRHRQKEGSTSPGLHPKVPSFGVPGTKTVEFCRGHANQGMVDVHRNKFAQQSCTKFP